MVGADAVSMLNVAIGVELCVPIVKVVMDTRTAELGYGPSCPLANMDIFLLFFLILFWVRLMADLPSETSGPWTKMQR
jgi:hypothetical protein